MNDRFLRACRREPVDATPVWFMRQAGRYMSAYRGLRERYGLLEICRQPELAAQVTLQPVDAIEVDAAILFSDLLLPLDPLGIPFRFEKGEGPVIDPPVRTVERIDRLRVFEPREARGRRPSGRTSILYAGLITAAKGCRTILAVARRLPEADFVLLGPVAADMDRHLHPLPPNVVLRGEIGPDDVLQHMKAGDLFLFPTRTEGFPNAVLEAMASGLPVVATRVGAIPEMVEEGKGGLLVDGADPQELVDALGFLLDKPEVRLRMGRFNHRKCREWYAYSVVAPRLTSLYRSILDGA